jgi:hypothetical protein
LFAISQGLPGYIHSSEVLRLYGKALTFLVREGKNFLIAKEYLKQTPNKNKILKNILITKFLATHSLIY